MTNFETAEPIVYIHGPLNKYATQEGVGGEV